MKSNLLLPSILLLLLSYNFTAIADNKVGGIEVAEGSRLSAAVGHYSRARQLLLSALKEFDSGVKVASPEVLINIKEWRDSINDRAEDLERVIAPQPRVTKDGITYPSEITIMGGSK
jgi:hypothetical protein